MKSYSLNDIKKEITHLQQKDLIQLCVNVAKFKKENKDYISFILFESHNKRAYLEDVKNDIKSQIISFEGNYFKYDFKKKLRVLKSFLVRNNKYLNDKALSVEMYIFLCNELRQDGYPYMKHGEFDTFYGQQIKKISNFIATLHEDLRYDFGQQLEELIS